MWCVTPYGREGGLASLLSGIAAFAVSSNLLPPGWEDVFRGIAFTAAVVLLISFLFLVRKGNYFGPMIESIHRRTG